MTEGRWGAVFGILFAVSAGSLVTTTADAGLFTHPDWRWVIIALIGLLVIATLGLASVIAGVFPFAQTHRSINRR